MHVSVLPAFSGNVPAALVRVFPSAKIERLGNWYVLLLNIQFSLPETLLQTLFKFQVPQFKVNNQEQRKVVFNSSSTYLKTPEHANIWSLFWK